VIIWLGDSVKLLLDTTYSEFKIIGPSVKVSSGDIVALATNQLTLLNRLSLAAAFQGNKKIRHAPSSNIS